MIDISVRDERIRSLRADGLSYDQIASEVQCGKSTVYCVINPKARAAYNLKSKPTKKASHAVKMSDPEYAAKYRDATRVRSCKLMRRLRSDLGYYSPERVHQRREQKRVHYATDHRLHGDRLAKRRSRAAERRRSDVCFRLAERMRNRMVHAIRGNQKNGSAVSDLGCSIKEFKEYIESLFAPGMTWDNWGNTWQLDHIKPLALFDLTDREQFLLAANWKNHQPLLIEDHKAKSLRDCDEIRQSKVVTFRTDSQGSTLGESHGTR